MKYVIVFAAYSFVSFLLGLAFLFPNRPADVGDFSFLMLVLIPILAVFDLAGQNIIDSDKVAAMGPAAKPAFGVLAFVAFIASVYMAVKMVAPATVPW